MSAMVGRSSTKWNLSARGGSHSDDTYARARRQGRRIESRAWQSEAEQEFNEIEVRRELDHLNDLLDLDRAIIMDQWQGTPAKREAYRLWECGLA